MGNDVYGLGNMNFLDIPVIEGGIPDASDYIPIWNASKRQFRRRLASTTSQAEDNYLDITTLGTGAASKAVVLDSGEDYTWPATGVLTYGVLNDGTTALGATAAELNNAADISAQAAIAANAATLTVTAALHAGKVVAFGKTDGTTVTLPAATGTGHIYRFVISITATSNANIIEVANATDVFDGSLNIQADTDVDGTLKCWMAEVGDDTMTFAGAATTGGIVGGHITVTDYAAGFFSCQAHTISGGGSEATPFSAAVS